VRQYREGDEAGINELFRKVFGVDRSLEEWRWKFRDEGREHLSLIHLACDGERIVGQYAAVGARFKFGPAEAVATQPVDNMIDPDSRQGLGRARMQRAMFQDGLAAGRAAGVAMAYGFPNREAYRVGKKVLGYCDLGAMEARLRSLTWARHVRRFIGDGRLARIVGRLHAPIHRAWLRLRGPGPDDAAARCASDFDERLDRLWAEASRSFGVLAVRDREYLRWRYGRRPGAPYTLLLLERGGDLIGYTVLTVKEGPVRIGCVVDIFSLPGEGIAEKLTVASLEHFLSEGADLAEVWLQPGGRYEKVLRAYFPRASQDPVHVVYQVLDEDLDGRFVSDFSNWHITMGDADGICGEGAVFFLLTWLHRKSN